MAKKNFKDVTGIKFADLMLPLIMGGIGSYSPAAGRGVGLGLQAFRTFQAGQAFGDERKEKKAYKEWAEQQTANAEQHLEQLRQGKIDPSEVEYRGFEGKRERHQCSLGRSPSLETLEQRLRLLMSVT
jgi:hypothetical protein